MNHHRGPQVAETALGPIQYLERGKSPGANHPVVITIHGAMGGYDQSDILGRTIGPDHFRYIAVSRPGYLETPLKGRARPEEQADLIAALLDHLGIEQAIFFAISGGGYSALHFALRHKDRCLAQVLCSTTGGRTDTPIPFAFHLMRLLARLPFFPGLMKKKLKHNIQGSLGRSVSHPDILAQTLKDETAMALFRELSLGVMDDMPKRLSGTANDIRITRSRDYPLKDIQVPTLVVHGSDDPHLPFEAHGRRLAEEIPGARLCLAEKGEHAAIFTHRKAVKAGVRDFLADLNLDG